jgi:hypothetical protein
MTRLNVRRVKTTLARSKASFLVFVVRVSVKIGINAMVREPSAKRRLNKLGIRRATKKASAAMPEPKRLAITISLTKPRIRLRKV